MWHLSAEGRASSKAHYIAISSYLFLPTIRISYGNYLGQYDMLVVAENISSSAVEIKLGRFCSLCNKKCLSMNLFDRWYSVIKFSFLAINLFKIV